MATTTGGLIENVGIYGDTGHYKITSPGTTSVAVKLPHLTLIKGAIVMILDSGNNIPAVGADITWSGNTLTVADGGSFTLADTMTIYVIAWGEARR